MIAWIDRRIDVTAWQVPGVEESQTAGKQPGYACGDDKSQTWHEDDSTENEHGDSQFGMGVAEEEDSDTEERKNDADLERIQNAGDGGGDSLILFEINGEGCGFKEALAGIGSHVDQKVLAVAEFIDELVVDVHLKFEDARPAAVLEDLPDEPQKGCGDAYEDYKGAYFIEQRLYKTTLVGLIHLWPDCSFQGLFGLAFVIFKV